MASLCRKQMKVLNILLVLFISQYMMLLVAADKDLTCKAGEAVASGEIFTSGLASQCSGISKITTEAETNKENRKKD